MNATANDLDITFRPPWYGLAFWCVSAGVMLLFGVFVMGPILEAPVWARFLFIGMSSLALVDGLVLSFAFVHVSHDGLESRHHTRWSVAWEEVAAWSQGGPGGSVYLRTRDGQIRGFSPWCVYGLRCDRIANVLARRLGPGATGDETVAPKFLLRVLGLLGR